MLTAVETRVVGVIGYAGAGKDTIADTLVQHRDYTRVAFADTVRDCAYELNPMVGIGGVRLQELVDDYGWDHVKRRSLEVRRLLQVMGTEVGRGILGETVWIDAAMRRIGEARGPVVIPDVRMPNEVDAVRALRGAVIVHVERPGVGPVNGHETERLAACGRRLADVAIDNDGGITDLVDRVLAVF